PACHVPPTSGVRRPGAAVRDVLSQSRRAGWHGLLRGVPPAIVPYPQAGRASQRDRERGHPAADSGQTHRRETRPETIGGSPPLPDRITTAPGESFRPTLPVGILIGPPLGGRHAPDRPVHTRIRRRWPGRGPRPAARGGGDRG